MIDDKVHKPRRSRSGRTSCWTPGGASSAPAACASDTIAKTGELGIFNRATTRAGVVPRPRSTTYSGNVVDICPWARSPTATSAPGRVQVPRPRESVCPGARAGAHRVHTNTKRPPRAGPAGRAPQAALQPRREPVVDLRRGAGFGEVDASTGSSAGCAGAGRRAPAGRRPWPGGRPPRRRPAGTGVLSRMSNEDLWLARRLFVDAGRRPRGFACLADTRLRTTFYGWPTGPRQPGRRAARVPGQQGAATGGTSSTPPARAGSGSLGVRPTSSTRMAPGRGGGARAGRGNVVFQGPAPTARARGRTSSCRRAAGRARRDLDERHGRISGSGARCCRAGY